MGLTDKSLDALRDSAVARYASRAGAWMSPRYRDLRARYYKLEKRERILLQLAAVVLGVLAGYNLIYLSIVSYQGGLEDEIAARQHDLIEVRRMASTYRQVNTELRALEKNTAPPASDFSLSSTLSTALNGVVETDKIAGINPLPSKPVSGQFTQYGSDLKLNGVSLAQVVDVLYRIKSIKEPVVVSNLSIRRRAQDPHSYDVDMTCSVLGKNA
jgi:type II secretory pathway component PulM